MSRVKNVAAKRRPRQTAAQRIAAKRLPPIGKPNADSVSARLRSEIQAEREKQNPALGKGTVQEVAHWLGVSKKTLERPPGPKLLNAACSRLGVTLDWLRTGNEPKYRGQQRTVNDLVTDLAAHIEREIRRNGERWINALLAESPERACVDVEYVEQVLLPGAVRSCLQRLQSIESSVRIATGRPPLPGMSVVHLRSALQSAVVGARHSRR